MRKYLLVSYLIAFLMSGCNQEEYLENQQLMSNGKTFTTSFEENDSRVYIDEKNELNWSESDYISVFNGSTLNSFYQFDGETGDKSGTFSHVHTLEGTDNALNTNYAVYPYSTDIVISANGVITATLPAEQSYVSNTFGLGDNTMVAVTQDTEDTFLKFQNVCGYLKIQLYGDNVTIKSITLTGNNNEKLAGKAMITPAYGQAPTISMADDAMGNITIDCGEGVKIGSTVEDATVFWFVVPPTKFEKGFTVTVTKDNGINFTKSTSNEIVIERNTIKPMDVISMSAFEMEVVPNNQIWYTSSDGNIVYPKFLTSPLYPNPFGATITSNIYKNGKGIITFDSDITSIGDFAFSECKTLTSITLPNSVASFGKYLFMDCNSLVSIIIPNNVAEIGGNMFNGCSSLKDVILPNSVTVIGGGAFANCSSLSEITLPENMTSIGGSAFNGCSSLESIIIPQKVTNIGSSVLGGCSSLASIIVEAGNTVYDSRENCNAIIETATNTLIQACDNTVIPNSVTTIANGAFSGCTFTEFTIPNNIITIDNNAFANNSFLKKVTISNGVTTINNWAFYCCYNLENVTISNSVTSIGDYAFSNCNNSLIEITIPNSVISIGECAFLYCQVLREITIPNSVTNIGFSILAGCNSLASITVENGNPVYDSRENCNAIIETATNTLVQGCETTVIPNSVTAIGDGAFLLCTMTEFIIPENVTKIGKNAFDGCLSLTNITIPSNVTSIGDEAFWSCSSLTRVNIKAANPPTIAAGTFKDCRSDLKVYVPATSLEAYKNADYWKNMTILPDSQ